MQRTARRLAHATCISVHRDRRTDRRRQDVARRAARDATRRHGCAGGDRESVPRRFLRRAAGRRAAGAALLSAQPSSPAARAAAGGLFAQTTVCDYLFDKDKIFAYLNLDDNELFIYQRLYDLLAKDMPPPDLVDLPAGADRRAASAGCASARRRRRMRDARARRRSTSAS